MTDFFKKNVGPESSWFCSLQTAIKFNTQTSKHFIFDSILSNRKQSPKCHRQLNMLWMNAMHVILTLRDGIPRFIGQLNTVFHECSAGCLILNFHAWEFVIVTIIVFNCLCHFGDCSRFDKMLSNIDNFVVWIVNLLSVCREQNGLLYYLDRHFSWENQLFWICNVPKSCGFIFWTQFITFTR